MQASLKRRARDFPRAQRRQMRRQLLNIEEIDSPRLKMIDQKQKRQLRGVRFPVEHTFPGEQPARIDAVQPADQLTGRIPRFDAVGDSQSVKTAIRGPPFPAESTFLPDPVYRRSDRRQSPRRMRDRR